MSPIASQSQMLLNSFPDDLYIFRDCLHLMRLETAFPAHLSLGALVYLKRMSTSVVVPACDEWSATDTFSSHLLVWALKMAWVSCGPEVSLPALHEECFRCRWWQKWGERSPCQRVCPVFAQPPMVLVEFAECPVQSSCLLSGFHATGCWPSGWPFKARWAWERFNSGLVPWHLGFLYFKGKVSCSSHLTQWDQGVFVSFHHAVVTVSPCCISNSDNVHCGCAYSVWK